MTTGKELQVTRTVLGVKAKDLAAVLGVNQSVISRWERSPVVTDEAAARHREGLARCVALIKE